MSQTITLRPMMSEKAYALSQNRNTYTFNVSKTVNCQQVAKAVAVQYKVTVTAVRMANVPGRSQSIISRRRRLNTFGQRSDVRKAYVTLKAGDKLPIFAAVEEAEKKTAAKESKK